MIVRTAFVTVTVFLLCGLGCGVVTVPNDATPPVDQNTADGADTVSDDDTSLTVAQNTAVGNIIAATEAVAKIVAVVAPVKDVEDSLAGGADFVACPAMDVALETDVLDLDLAYAAGCGTSHHPDVSVDGTVSGELYYAVDAVELEFTDLNIDGDVLTGRVAGGFGASAAEATFAVNVNVALGDVTITGGATVIVDEQTGAMSVRDATLTVSAPDCDDVTAVLANVVIDPNANANFAPESGSLTFDLWDESTQTTVQLVVDCTADTPTTGTAKVAVEGADPTTYVPAD